MDTDAQTYNKQLALAATIHTTFYLSSCIVQRDKLTTANVHSIHHTPTKFMCMLLLRTNTYQTYFIEKNMDVTSFTFYIKLKINMCSTK